MDRKKTLSRAFGAPLKYIQGPDEFDSLPEYIQIYGTGAFALIDGFLYADLGGRLDRACGDAALTCTTERFQGECTEAEVQRVVDLCVGVQPSVLLGIGGGKTLDTIKFAANRLNLPFILVPTSASTDAPTSSMSVLYSEQGEHLYCTIHKKGADIVLLDTKIIAKAPIRLFVAGMGDALSTWFEAKANEASGHVNEIGKGYQRTLLSMAVAELCYKTIIESGELAKTELENGLCTTTTENVIEANTLLSGLGFENTGESAAHGIHSGLTALSETARFFHGEKVAFGTICELILENAPRKELEEVIGFCYRVGLPVTLSDLNVSATEENIRIIAKKTVENHLIHSEPVVITEEVVYNAIAAADIIGRQYKQKVSILSTQPNS